MNVNEFVVNLIRTWVPALVGAGLTYASDALDIRDIDTAAAAGVAVTLLTGTWYTAVRWAERRWPNAGWLLGYAAHRDGDAT